MDSLVANGHLTQVPHWTLQSKLALPTHTRSNPPFYYKGVLNDPIYQRLNIHLSSFLRIVEWRDTTLYQPRLKIFCLCFAKFLQYLFLFQQFRKDISNTTHTKCTIFYVHYCRNPFKLWSISVAVIAIFTNTNTNTFTKMIKGCWNKLFMITWLWFYSNISIVSAKLVIND